MSEHKLLRAQTCVGINVSGHKHERAQTCVGANVSGHKRVWAQMCLGTNVCGHSHVVTVVRHNHVYGLNRGGTDFHY